MLLSRRSLLAAASLAAAPIPAWARAFSSGQFTHGVASGDPLPDGIVLWTRFQSAADATIGWEIANDENFQHVVQRGQANSSAANDYCAKADVRGLQPGRHYFYRFLSASGPSITGRTRTAPTGSVASTTFAFFSCSNFPFGYFHAYGHAARRDDIDFVMHVGDYIYEGHRGAYPSPSEAVPGRVIEPAGEVYRLQDYYQRYACYHTDASLLELRRLKPMCVVWDDHELANNAWRDGAENHHPETEGRWSDRVAAATKAYFNWMPIRHRMQSDARIYRTMDWGDLARFVLIDTRYIGRSEQLDYPKDLMPQLNSAGADKQALARQFLARLRDPHRSMMGAAQEQWFAQQLAQSKRNGQPWQVVAQQVVMGEQIAPAGLGRLLPNDASRYSRDFFDGSTQLAELGLPWNLDCWNGYPGARERFLAACAANANNTLVLGGDSHNCWFNNLRAPGNANRLAAIEFAGGSVTSPGFEHSLTNAQPGERERLLKAANPILAYCDLTNRGYGAVKLTRTACEADWLAFADVKSPQMPEPEATRLTSASSANAGPGAWSI